LGVDFQMAQSYARLSQTYSHPPAFEGLRRPLDRSRA
jgi:hypothetical protein